MNFGDEYIVSVAVKETSVEIVKRQPSNIMYACMPPRPAPDSVWKEIYTIQDGKLVLSETLSGKHEPSYNVNESITFE